MPSDWNAWYTNCSRCGTKYHQSEGGCGCLDDYVECGRNGGSVFRKGFGNIPGRLVKVECYIHCDDDSVEIGEEQYCEEHATCEGCGIEHTEKAPLVDLDGDIYCPKCLAEEEAESVNTEADGERVTNTTAEEA